MTVIAPMGKGKTMFATVYAVEYSQKYPSHKIYANYRLNLQNAVYTPCMFLPFRRLKDCLIIFDDIYSSRNLETLIGVIVNLSRKSNIEIIITAQYYTMIPKLLRTLAQNVIVEFDKNEKKLNIALEYSLPNDRKKYRLYTVNKPIDIINGVYDTNEIVDFATPSKIFEEIKKFSENAEDLELNVSLYTQDKKQILKLTQELCEEMGFNYKAKKPKAKPEKKFLSQSEQK